MDAQLVAQPMAAAIGAGLPIHEPLGNMIVDIGGGTSETAMISLGGIVALEAIRVGSFDIDASIQAFVRREYGMAIGERTAEEIKLAIGSAAPVADDIKAEVRGRDLMSGLPKTAILSPEEVREAIDENVRAMVESVVKCLGHAPPELAQDLIQQGIHLVGGGAMLRGFDQRLAEETELPVHLVEAPLECVVLGAGKCLEAFESLKVLFMGAER
jgi:rod shape-determining protein MreB